MVFTLPTQKSTYQLPSSTPAQKPLVTSTKQITQTYKIPDIPSTSSLPQNARIAALSSKSTLDFYESKELARLSGVPDKVVNSKNFGALFNATKDVKAFIDANVPKPVTVKQPTIVNNPVSNMQTYKIPEMPSVQAKTYTIPSKPYTIPSQTNKPFQIPNIITPQVSNPIKKPALYVPTISSPSIKNTLQEMYPNTLDLSKTDLPKISYQIGSVKIASNVPSIPEQVLETAPATYKLSTPTPILVAAPVSVSVISKTDPAPDVTPAEVYDMKGNRVDMTQKSSSEPVSSNIIEVDGIKISLMPENAGTVNIYENGQPVYVGASLNEAKILDSFKKSIDKYYDTWPEYIEGKQQCIQDAAYAINNWRKDLVEDDDSSNDNWYKYARMAILEDDWHAIVVVSPNGMFANPKKDHIFDPRSGYYSGTIRNYDSSDESLIKIYDKFDTVTRTDEFGNDYEETTWLDQNQSHVTETFVPNSDSETENFISGTNSDEASKIKIDAAERRMTDYITGAIIDSIYYQSKNDPNIKYDEASFKVNVGKNDQSNFIKMNPDGTIWTGITKEDEDYYNKITVSNLDSSMSIKNMAFSLANQIYGPDFSIPEMVEIYQFLQKYSKDGKFDTSKLTEINKELGSTLKIQEVGSFSVLPDDASTDDKIMLAETFIPSVYDAKTNTWIEDPGLSGNSIKTIISGSNTEIPKSYVRNEYSELVKKIDEFTSNFYKKNKRPVYNAPNWICVDYVKMMVDAAKKEGLPAYAATGVVSEKGTNHAFVAFDLSGRMDLLEDYVPSSKLGLYAPQEFVLYEPQSDDDSIDHVPGPGTDFSMYNHIDILKNPIYYIYNNNGQSELVDYNNNVLRFRNIKYSDILGNDSVIFMNKKNLKIDDYLIRVGGTKDTGIVGNPDKKSVAY
jgi:hypothetical protein